VVNKTEKRKFKEFFCEIEKSTLDRLVDYAERLFSLTEIKLVVEPKRSLAYPCGLT